MILNDVFTIDFGNGGYSLGREGKEGGSVTVFSVRKEEMKKTAVVCRLQPRMHSVSNQYT
jgi:hypothetical protein